MVLILFSALSCIASRALYSGYQRLVGLIFFFFLKTVAFEEDYLGDIGRKKLLLSLHETSTFSGCYLLELNPHLFLSYSRAWQIMAGEAKWLRMMSTFLKGCKKETHVTCNA